MHIVILTDLEGVSGIIDWDLHQPYTPLDRWQRTLMTGEVNAAVAGAFDAGATRVKVTEGHTAVEILELDDRATLVSCTGPTLPLLCGWDEGFDALLQIGCHSMAGTPDGVLAHTGNRSVEFVEINGVRMGEIGVVSASAGDLGIPCVMVSGDAAACREARALLGNIEAACVKTGYGTHYADSLAPAAARRLIREKTASALRRIGEFRPFVIPGPITVKERLITERDREQLAQLRKRPDAEVIDAKTVVYRGENVLEAYARRCGVLDLPAPRAAEQQSSR